ncbi:carbon monoxide dehydrogenase subunit G [Variovorax boronicumulans]|uniref:CoxG family protein n=1 Tax=Variovorax boronicumulans TaxID=436515 RepID=UPI003390A5C0
MEIEKTLFVSAAREQVWALLLDPQVMGGAVPGMKSIEVISPTEYVAVMHQKIAFISAKFKLRTHIVEQRAPEYLRAEGTGEDASVASSLKQSSEVFLTATPEGGTELRIKVNVDVLGRLGTFGLSVMKTKADRMWEEFGANLKARIESGELPATATATSTPATTMPAPAASARVAVASVSAPKAPLESAPSAAVVAATPTSGTPSPAAPVQSVSVAAPAESGWWSRLFGGSRAGPVDVPSSAQGRNIRIEVRQMNQTVTIDWPIEQAPQCREWLRELLNK